MYKRVWTEFKAILFNTMLPPLSRVEGGQCAFMLGIMSQKICYHSLTSLKKLVFGMRLRRLGKIKIHFKVLMSSQKLKLLYNMDW